MCLVEALVREREAIFARAVDAAGQQTLNDLLLALEFVSAAVALANWCRSNSVPLAPADLLALRKLSEVTEHADATGGGLAVHGMRTYLRKVAFHPVQESEESVRFAECRHHQVLSQVACLQPPVS